MKTRLLFSFLVAYMGLFHAAIGQNPGDTITVQAFNYNSNTRDSTIVFSALPNVPFEKVLMQYSMRCKDGVVNTAGGNTIGCGEWDYSCNTYVHDLNRADSINATTPSHSIAGFAGTTFNYSVDPTFNIFQQNQQSTVVNSVISETTTALGNGNSSLQNVLPTAERNAKSQYLFTAAQLSAAGFTAGEIDAIEFNVLSGSASTQNLRCKLKTTTKTNLLESDPDLVGWNTVYFQNTSLQAGINRLQFSQPFMWNGTSNIILELSYSNLSNGTNLNIQGGNLLGSVELAAKKDFVHVFNGANYVEANSYRGIGGSDARSVEAWIKTTVPNKEIVSWGQDVPGEKWVFRINETGELRVEVAGGNTWGTTILTDGLWHHVACVFSGTMVSDIQLYVDGQLETIAPGGVNLDINTNTLDGLRVRVSRGVNDRYFEGDIDDVRVWNTALSATTIGQWRYRNISGTHPNSSNLALHYTFGEGNGTVVNDQSGNNRHAQSINGGLWKEIRGEDLFKGFESSVQRPNITLVRGDYNQTTTNVVTNDTIFNLANFVTTFAISPNPGTQLSDNIVVTAYNAFWQATQNNTFNTSGVLINSQPVAVDGTINITTLSYLQRRPMRIELLSFVTPFGIGLDLGPNGKTWTFDVSDFRPIFNGSRRLTMERGGQLQEDIDIKFQFIVGTPPRNVLSVNQIWRAENLGYQSIQNNAFFEPRDVPTSADATFFKLRSAITGHGQEGEFIPQTHWLNVDGGDIEFQWEVWKECAENPIYPQGGTWIYDRAGWCPGMPTDLVENDISTYVTPGQPVNLDYGIITAQGASNYIVSHQLISYGSLNHNLDAAILEVRKPSNRVEFTRIGTICDNPEIVIENRGAQTLNSAQIIYWINDPTAVQTFEWTGSLGFLEKAIIELPGSIALWGNSNPFGSNNFQVELTAVNGGADDYAFNNSYRSSFDIPGVVPENMIIIFQTNAFAAENSYEVVDVNGNVVFARNNMENNTLYEDTLLLAEGCYTYNVFDSDDDGLSFFDNSDGNGFTRFKEVGGPTFLFFENDFGDNIRYSFTVNQPLSAGQRNAATGVSIYPNPSRDNVTIEANGFGAQLNITVFDASGRVVLNEKFGNGSSHFVQQIDLSNLSKGVYMLQVSDGAQQTTSKILKL